MIGLVLALAVIGIAVSLVGHWVVGIVIGAVATILFALFLTGIGRRAASRRP